MTTTFSLKQKLDELNQKFKIARHDTDLTTSSDEYRFNFVNDTENKQYYPNLLLLNLLHYRYRDGFRNNKTLTQFCVFCLNSTDDYDDFNDYCVKLCDSRKEIFAEYQTYFFAFIEIARDMLDEILAGMTENNEKNDLFGFKQVDNSSNEGNVVKV